MNILKVGPIEKLTRRDSDAPEYTKHIWYDAEAGRLVATNGHALVIAATEPDVGDVSGLLSVQSIEYARAYAKRSAAATIRVICEATCLRFPDGSTLPRPAGDFPDYAAIVPKVSGPPTITFNPDLLALIVAAFPKQELGKKGLNPGSISLWSTDLTPFERQTAAAVLRTAAGFVQGGPDTSTSWTQEQSDACRAAAEKLLANGDKPIPIVVKAHYDGGLAVLMPVSGMDPAKWNTELPRGVRQE